VVFDVSAEAVAKAYERCDLREELFTAHASG
jgi:hypothetical protein